MGKLAMKLADITKRFDEADQIAGEAGSAIGEVAYDERHRALVWASIEDHVDAEALSKEIVDSDFGVDVDFRPVMEIGLFRGAIRELLRERELLRAASAVAVLGAGTVGGLAFRRIVDFRIGGAAGV